MLNRILCRPDWINSPFSRLLLISRSLRPKMVYFSPILSSSSYIKHIRTYKQHMCRKIVPPFARRHRKLHLIYMYVRISRRGREKRKDLEYIYNDTEIYVSLFSQRHYTIYVVPHYFRLPSVLIPGALALQSSLSMPATGTNRSVSVCNDRIMIKINSLMKRDDLGTDLPFLGLIYWVLCLAYYRLCCT
jgi:hypothetical protein